MRIEKLTEEQQEKFPEYVGRWLDIGLSTEPLDRDEAAKAIDEVYKCAGMKPPAFKVFLDSPFGGAVGAIYLKSWKAFGAQVEDHVRDQVVDHVEAQVWAQVRDQVRAQVGDQVEDHVWDQVRAQVGDQVGAQVWAQVWAEVEAQVGDQVEDHVRAEVRAEVEAQVWAQVGDQVDDQVWAQVRDQVGAQVYKAGYGSYDASWLAFYEFFLKETQLKCCEKLSGLMQAAMTLGWFWPFEGAVIITPRPVKINMEDGRLHCENGPAILYPDGWGVYAWRGTRVPKEWIESPETLTPEMAITWDNVEQRRCIAEIVGWHNVLDRLNAKTVDKDKDPEIGELLEVDIPDIGRERFLRVQCGTKRTFALPVPPDTNTALDAQAWLNFCTTEDILDLETRT